MSDYREYPKTCSRRGPGDVEHCSSCGTQHGQAMTAPVDQPNTQAFVDWLRDRAADEWVQR